MSDPQGAVAWYAIGAGEGEPANYIKMSFNLSRLPDDTKVVTIPGSERIDLQLADGVWLCITKVGDSLA